MVAKRIHCLVSLPVWAVLVWAVILIGPANGATIRVPQDYSTINGAINYAWGGDEIVVSPGVYVENVNFRGRSFILRSTNPTDTATVAATIIDGGGNGPVVTFLGSETSGCVLSGFTIRNGSSAQGGGIRGNGTNARIERNTITGNSVYSSSAYGSGGGLYGCKGTIQNNVITGNSATGHASGYGGGLCYCGGTIQDNVITGNSATGGNPGYSGGGGGGGLAFCNGTIQDNVITGNSATGYNGGYGGGLYGCGARIQNNTITGNSAGAGGGLSECSGVIVNCIIWDNPAAGGEMYSCSIPSYSCILGYTGGGQGNTAQEPRFRGPNDFHLQANSPCIDAGTNQSCPATDKDGYPRPYDGNGDGLAVCDMGAYEYVLMPPHAPVLSAEPPYTSGTSNRVSWGAVTGAAAYYVEWSGNSSFTPVAGNTGWTTAVSHLATNLLDGQINYYRVKCRNVVLLESGWSNVVSSRQDASPPIAPGTPTDAGLYTSSTAVRFSWTAATDGGSSGSGVASYDLQVGTSPGGSNILNANVGNVLTRTITGGNGQTLYARVRAHDGAGNIGPWSGDSDGILVDAVAPTAPGTPRDAGAYTSSTVVRFNWTAAMDGGSGVASYDLQIGTSPSGSNVFNANVGNVLTRTVTGANGQTLYARVRARDRARNIGAWSANSDGITVDTVRPRLIAVTALDYVTLQVTFDEPVSNADKVLNYTCTGGLALTSATRLTDSQYRLKTTGQQTGTTYVLTVQSVVKDRAGNPIDPAYRSHAFVGGIIARYTLLLSSSPVQGGTIVPNPLPGSDGKYATGTMVSLTANANPGYSFARWNGDISGSNNPTQVTMSSTKSVTAEFALLPAIAFSPTTLTPTCTVGQNAHSETFEVWNSGGGTLSYTLLGNASWISSITPSSGTSTGEHNTHSLRFDTSGLSVGTYETDIAINGLGASNTPQYLHVTLTVYVPSNLTLSHCDFAPSAPVQLQPGASVSVGAFIDNNDNGPAGPFWLEFWGSRTGGLTLDYPNLVVNSESIGGLAAHESRSITTTKALNPIPDGPYTVVFVVDRPNQVPESNEGDNRFVVRGKRLLVIRPQTNVDLVVENFSLGPNPSASGQPIQLGGQVRNAGTENSGPFWIEFWGSRPDLYPDLHFMLCDSIRIDNLAPASAVQLSSSSRTLYPVPSGMFWVGCFADRPDSINELDETNNFQFVPGHVFNIPHTEAADSNKAETPGQSLPDLLITDFDFTPCAPTQSKPGDIVTISITIANQGSADAGPFWMEWWGSNLGGLNIWPQLIDQSLCVSGLRAGENRTMTLTRPLMGVPDGPYTVVAVLDRPGQVAESNEGNNRYAVSGKRVLVVPPSVGANLVLENFDVAPDPLRRGLGFQPSGRVRNSGTENSGVFWIEFWGSWQQVYPELNFMLCDSINVDNLGPGQVLDLANYPRTVYADVPLVSCAIGCFVDRVDQVSETDESDNYRFLTGRSIVP